MGSHLAGKQLVVRVRCALRAQRVARRRPDDGRDRLGPLGIFDWTAGAATNRDVPPLVPRQPDPRARSACALGAALAGLYALVPETRSADAGRAATNRVLLFVLFYIVVVLILVLLFVLVRSAVRLVLEARRGVFGSRFRVRVVATNVGLALLPIVAPRPPDDGPPPEERRAVVRAAPSRRPSAPGARSRISSGRGRRASRRGPARAGSSRASRVRDRTPRSLGAPRRGARGVRRRLHRVARATAARERRPRRQLAALAASTT